MPKDTKSLGNNKAPACESRGFVRKKKKVCFFDTPSSAYANLSRINPYKWPSDPPRAYCA